MDDLLIRPVQRGDIPAWEEMRKELWPSEPHHAEIARFFDRRADLQEEVFLAFTGSGEPIGFIELSIRKHAEGCSSDRVAYIEGWFVVRPARGKGIGTALVRTAESWGEAQGCAELASDADLGNDASIAAHLALGFSETGRAVCFRKDLGAPGR